jgi:uncharacterized protein with HEPN domain
MLSNSLLNTNNVNNINSLQPSTNPILTTKNKNKSSQNSIRLANSNKKPMIATNAKTLWDYLDDNIKLVRPLLESVLTSYKLKSPDVTLLTVFNDYENYNSDSSLSNNMIMDACAFLLVRIGECVTHFNPAKKKSSKDRYTNIYKENKIFTRLRNELIHHLNFEKLKSVNVLLNTFIIEEAKISIENTATNVHLMPSRTLKLRELVTNLDMLQKTVDKSRNLEFQEHKSKGFDGVDPIFTHSNFNIIAYKNLETLINDRKINIVKLEENDQNIKIAFIYRVASIMSVIKDTKFIEKFKDWLIRLNFLEKDSVSDECPIKQKDYDEVIELSAEGMKLHKNMAHNYNCGIDKLFSNYIDLYKSIKKFLPAITFVLKYEQLTLDFINKLLLRVNDTLVISSSRDLSTDLELKDDHTSNERSIPKIGTFKKFISCCGLFSKQSKSYQNLHKEKEVSAEFKL